MRHTTKDGRVMKISEMSDNHLRNTIRFLRRRADAGIEVESGGADGGEVWYDTYELHGSSALTYLDYEHYVAEANKRGLNYETILQRPQLCNLPRRCLRHHR